MNGSLRQRGPSSWELRVYDGVDPAVGVAGTRRARSGGRAISRLLHNLDREPRASHHLARLGITRVRRRWWTVRRRSGPR
jgi:hypothetical protein